MSSSIFLLKSRYIYIIFPSHTFSSFLALSPLSSLDLSAETDYQIHFYFLRLYIFWYSFLHFFSPHYRGVFYLQKFVYRLRNSSDFGQTGMSYAYLFKYIIIGDTGKLFGFMVVIVIYCQKKRILMMNFAYVLFKILFFI